MQLGRRLRETRERVGLTQAAAAEKSGVGHSSLCEFENGRREPRLVHLAALAKCYHCDLWSFFSEAPASRVAVRWCRRPEKDAGLLENQFLQLCHWYRNLELWSKVSAPSELPCVRGACRPSSVRDAEELSKQVRNSLQLGNRPGALLLRVLEEDFGLKVFHLPLEVVGGAGCARSPEFGAAVLLDAASARRRRTIDLAHALFHLLTWDDADGPGRKDEIDEETLAHSFAAALLMPEEVVRTAVHRRRDVGGLTWPALFEIAREFEVPSAALLSRFQVVFGLSNEATRNYAEECRAWTVLLEPEEEPSPPKPARFRALAVALFNDGEISTGRFAEYLGIGRHAAMNYLPPDKPLGGGIELPLS